MTRLEIALAFLENFRGFAIFACACCIIATIFFLASLADAKMDLDFQLGTERAQKRIEKNKRLWWRPLLCSFLICPFALIPSIEQVWKIRIGLIKFQLASPENIAKGAAVIERIGHKLECKYLGCKDTESSSEPEK